MRRLLIPIIAISLAVLPACRSRPAFTRATTDQATFTKEAVAADHPVASAAGAEILARGGNAIDAAVAAGFTLSVVRPYSCGIGGGGFMVAHLAATDHEPARQIAINYRETCPRAVTPDYFERFDDALRSRYGGAAVATPGTVAGLLHALESHGTLDRQTVLAPAIRAARRGFVVDDHYASAARSLTAKFEANPGWKDRFAFVWDRFLRRGRVKVGDRIRNPEQARALELIARHGSSAFYEGPIARAITDAVSRDAGELSLADLKMFHVEQAPPARAQVQSLRFVGMPPPSSGGVTMFQALLILDALGVDLRAPNDSPERLHLLVESLKHAFADRAEWFGDPAFVDVPAERLLSRSYVRELAARVDRARTRAVDAYGSRAPPPESGGTSHVSVVDRFGNAVACTETINLEFGSLVAVPEYGFVLNDEMDDFLTRPGEANAFGLTQGERNLPAPGKRPLSSMSPTIVLDDRGVLAVAGASGGPRIITGTLQALLRTLEGAGAGEAVRARRVHHQWLPDVIQAEDGALRPDLAGALEAMGHEVGSRRDVGNVQLIRRARSGEGWEAASDPRKGGRPAGR